ncbi:hypothetical protein LMH87_005524 [Akanthomyces muscarius]|uniref:Uncharacterized protein n=1 Tax=Akanthomyces muscarius TaxID=2231603 RepID=A0A9W8QMP9_AKAMU|nr:hypothetical protein LMH87_005524 [Akanthomyces muscarius]KAJ4163820.1 hypothetical protein LMH87_005524 [Akanthomyces muscarius]
MSGCFRAVAGIRMHPHLDQFNLQFLSCKYNFSMAVLSSLARLLLGAIDVTPVAWPWLAFERRPHVSLWRQ